MLKYCEYSVLMRPLNFLRIKHDFSVSYNTVYPSIFSAIFIFLVLKLNNASSIFGETGLISKILQLLAILAPFFIAALAAISTLGKEINETMKGKVVPHIYLRVNRKWEKTDLTTRYFLSLLFGYCSINSIALFLWGLIATFFANGIKFHIVHFASEHLLLGSWISINLMILCKYFFFYFYILFFTHLMLITLIGIYYLADKLHRP
jgi:hypothetical protein